MRHYPHHIGDFDRATRHLTRIERSVYRDLLDLYYDTERCLTLDVAALCRRIVARSNEESTAVEQVLNEFFTKTPDGWYNDRCEAEIEAYLANCSQKALAGKASAAARRQKKQHAINGRPTAVEQPLNAVATESNGDATNQEPSTKNHQPKKDAPRKRVTPPDSFDLPDWVNKTHWDTWHSSPKRKKATDDQKRLSLAKLQRWRDEGKDYAGALENAAVGGWQGLFLPEAKTTFAQQAADIARVTVPPRQEIDPVLAELTAHKGSAPPPEVREKMAAILRR